MKSQPAVTTLLLIALVAIAATSLTLVQAACGPNVRCPSDASNYLLPHPDCTQYYRCDAGTACEQSCPPGLHFNAYHRQCEAPETACCDIYYPCNPTV
uniref:Putative secreted protein n=1 Tax=Anopheles triannulatus TaxID=58253 RepID=A0A2M4B087_9DIPT